MAIKDKDRKARANYKRKVVTVRVDLYGTDEDIKAHIDSLRGNGESVTAFIKSAIREKMERAEA